jgi:hypothetical protein
MQAHAAAAEGFEYLGDSSTAYTEYSLAANAAYLAREFMTAEKYNLKVVDMARLRGDTNKEASCRYVLYSLNKNFGKPLEAHQHMNASIQLYKKLNDNIVT